MTRFYTNSQNANNLTKVSKKNKFYFRTLTRSNIERVYCETNEIGMQYIEDNGIDVEKEIELKIEATEKGGQKYIIIYEVCGVNKQKDEHIVMDHYLNKKDAEEYKEFCYRVHSKRYDVFYIREVIVWC